MYIVQIYHIYIYSPGQCAYCMLYCWTHACVYMWGRLVVVQSFMLIGSGWVMKILKRKNFRHNELWTGKGWLSSFWRSIRRGFRKGLHMVLSGFISVRKQGWRDLFIRGDPGLREVAGLGFLIIWRGKEMLITAWWRIYVCGSVFELWAQSGGRWGHWGGKREAKMGTWTYEK
jgi:hypothetical protein